MKRFKFNLQRLLDYRKTVEDARLGELAAIRAELEREAQRLAEMRSTECILRGKMKEKLEDSDADAIRQAYLYLQQFSQSVMAQEQALRIIEEKREQKTAEVVEAAKDRKALERLKEYKLIDYRAEAQRQEQKFLDDITSIRYGKDA